MQKTAKLGLNKPDLTDYVNISDLNENMDVLDEAVGNAEDGLTTHLADDASTTKKGHVQLSNNTNSDSETLAVTPKALKSHVTDYVKHPGYGSTTGVNAYNLTLTNAPPALVEGMGVVIKIGSNATGNCTLNVNGLGAKSILKSDNTVVKDLKAGAVYTLRYNGTSFILQGEGRGVSNVADKIIKADKFQSSFEDGVSYRILNKSIFKYEHKTGTLLYTYDFSNIISAQFNTWYQVVSYSSEGVVISTDRAGNNLTGLFRENGTLFKMFGHNPPPTAHNTGHWIASDKVYSKTLTSAQILRYNDNFTFLEYIIQNTLNVGGISRIAFKKNDEQDELMIIFTNESEYQITPVIGSTTVKKIIFNGLFAMIECFGQLED